MRKAIFIDKDGTLIYNLHYNVNPSLITLTEGAVEGLQKCINVGYEIYIISNQQGIALGYFSENKLIPVKNKLDELLAPYGITLSGFYYCPHKNEDNCYCRKPKPGLIFQAAADDNIDLYTSWMIGDTPTDIQAGKSAGCNTILFDKGYENKWKFTTNDSPDFVVKTLDEAADYILNSQVQDNSDKYNYKT